MDTLVQSAGVVPGQPGSGVLGFLAGRMIRAGLRSDDGMTLAWAAKGDPGALTVMAQAQVLTQQLRAARAMMPMEFDDTEDFSNPYLGAGEKLVMSMPPQGRAPFATYTWDTGTHLITLQAVAGDPERFGTFAEDLDHLARSLRFADDVELGESNVLRLPPA